jgi:hypothetical protein
LYKKVSSYCLEKLTAEIDMNIPLDRIDKISESISLLFLLTCAMTLLCVLPSLPDRVQIHFDGGAADRFGNKYIFLLIFIIAFVLYVGLTILAKYPTLYKNRLTERNLEEQYKLAAKMIRTLKLCIMFFFTVLIFTITQTAQLKMIGASNLLILLPFILFFPTVIYYLIKFGKIR